MGKYGIIYADFAHSVINGSWGGESYSYTAGGDFKDYYVGGTYDEGPFPANDILVAEGDGNERFLIMTIEDVSSSDCWWYGSASEDGMEVITETGIGLNEEGKEIGKSNTEKMLAKWTEDENVPENNRDIWGLIGENSKWFVPSKDEWLAFVDAFNVFGEWDDDLVDTVVPLGLSIAYWSSSQIDTMEAYYVDFRGDDISGATLEGGSGQGLRLSATF